MRLIVLFVLSILLAGCTQSVTTVDTTLDYPASRIDSNVVDVYHGTRVSDPYRWLEDDRSAETAAWVNAQNEFTNNHLSGIVSKEAIRSRLQRLYDYERYSVPQVAGTYMYYGKNNGLQNQSIIYREPLEGGKRELVLDPNTFSADNTSSLSAYSFSDDGHYMAYQISEGGSDWKTIHVKDLNTGEDIQETIEWVKFSGISWMGDGFYYARYDEPQNDQVLSGKNENHKLYYHRIGTQQESDILIFKDPQHPQRNVSGTFKMGSNHLVITQTESTSGNSVLVCPVEKNSGKINTCKTIVTGFDSDYTIVGFKKEHFYFWTNDSAANGKVVKINPTHPTPAFEDVIEEEQTRVLKSVTLSGDKLYVRYLENVQSTLEVKSLSGAFVHQIELPGIGTTTGVSAPAAGGEAFYSFSSFTTPGTVYRLRENSTQPEVWNTSDNGFDESLYTTKQIRYKSKDGTEIPMFIVHKKGLKLDGKRPTLLYGYGGFDISIEPKHAVMRLDLVSPILEQNGVIAVANIRGGGEFGSQWHKAGTKSEKQNVFDDFIAATEFLQNNGYTCPSRMAIYGRSNGGLLVGACITQRPELFGVAFPAVGVLDMLRYHQFTIGWAWAGDYGRADSIDAFRYLHKYSPLHNATPQDYPATMITTADHDDRVVPAHSFKFAATLQQAQQATEPILIRIDKSSGHGAGKPIAKQIEEATDLLAFMFHHMELDYQEINAE